MPGESALAASEDVLARQARVAPAGITDSTPLELAFALDATVGEVNRLPRRIQGRIVSQRAGNELKSHGCGASPIWKRGLGSPGASAGSLPA